ncbi:MAG: branched-chain-amino-acid transaminase [Acidobacteriota bacterium]|nr:branched-chain-amino-acid transaminase [Acidobacteriota bacterium]MDH3784094.1 branched-chain-amino-acid transaminase [Acidobacteriota bacterium]
MYIYLNGKLVPDDQAKVSVFDHGLLYGDGVFEGIRVYEGNIFRLREHIDRLFESAKTIGLDVQMTVDELEQATIDTVVANDMRDAYIRLVMTRGVGDLGIDPRNCPKPTLFIICSTISLYPKEFYDNGIALVTASTRRIPLECLDPRIKSLNYLNNILAKIEAGKAGVPEAVMLNLSGRVAECTADNIFILRDGRLKTPRLTEGALPGVTRGAVLELAQEAEVGTHETVLGLHDLYNADECFLTGTGAEIVPVISIDGRQIADGKPGTLTFDLLDRFRKLRVRDGMKVDYDRTPTLTG